MAVGDLVLIERQDDNAFVGIPPEVFSVCLFEIVEDLGHYLFVKLTQGPTDNISANTWRRSGAGQYVKRSLTSLFPKEV